MPARPLVFRPLVETRVASALPGLALAAAGAHAVLQADDMLLFAAALVPAAFGVVLVIRGYRMAVIVDGRTVVVHGTLRTRAIPRGAVDALHDGDTTAPFAMIPSLHWHDDRGTARRARLWMFGEPGRQCADVTGHNRRTISHLRKSLGVSHTGYGRPY